MIICGMVGCRTAFLRILELTRGLMTISLTTLGILIAIPGILHAIYRVGKIEVKSWELIGLALTWGALWPLMLLLRWSQPAFESFRRGIKDGKWQSQQGDVNRESLGTAEDQDITQWGPVRDFLARNHPTDETKGNDDDPSGDLW